MSILHFPNEQRIIATARRELEVDRRPGIHCRSQAQLSPLLPYPKVAIKVRDQVPAHVRNILSASFGLHRCPLLRHPEKTGKVGRPDIDNLFPRPQPAFCSVLNVVKDEGGGVRTGFGQDGEPALGNVCIGCRCLRRRKDQKSVQFYVPDPLLCVDCFCTMFSGVKSF